MICLFNINYCKVILHTMFWHIYTTVIVRLDKVANARPRPGKRRRWNGWMVVTKNCRDLIMLSTCKKIWLETNFIGCRRHGTEAVNFIG